MHHIVSDGWSMGVLMREVAALYEVYSRGETPSLQELPVQYADYAIWQREWLQGEALERQLDYWRGQLAGAPQALELPTDKPRPPTQSYRGAGQSLALDAELAGRLNALSRAEGATLFMTLLAAFQLLLSRYSGRADVSVGTPVANRGRSEVAGLIGFFVNTLVLRTDLSGDPTFRELLARVREVCLGAYAHQDVPFERIVEELQPERDLSRNPLFQVMFVLQHAAAAPPELPGLEMSMMPVGNATTKFDLTMAIEETPAGLRAALEYNTDLFGDALIGQLLRHFETLLRALADEPGLPVSSLELLDADERRQVLEGWNQTAEPYEAATLHGLFEEQARRTPGDAALVAGGRRLTYRELNERADELAARLRGVGVGPEALVGVCAERSSEMVVAVLAVLKAGGAYVPLDPRYPRERLAFMLRDSGAKVLLTERHLTHALPEHEATMLYLDERAEPPPAVGARGEATASPDNLAYVIYTSGSTGTPKGVSITHASACTLLRWAQGVFSREELGGVLFSTSICFDLSIFEMFAPLSSGGKVVLAEDALALPSLEAREEVTLVNTVPSAMTELTRSGGVPASVLAVALAGEPLRRDLVQQVYGATRARRVLNLYGPTEDTTYSTWADVARGEGERVTIGRPVANTRAYILDARLRPVPAGVAGELYLSGEGLARGYLNRPALTAERFIPDPFGPAPGARMYRTGDVARHLEGGEIEYLGRSDEQVKVRGFRIELGEVEAALRAAPGVREAVVAARGDGADKLLVAYVVADESAGTGATDWREHLRGRLPEYMVPSAFVTLDALPLTPNGKVDRKALPEPEAHGLRGERAFVPPRNVTEFRVAQVWEDVLGVRPVGVKDNFFDLGGHSLQAVRLMSKLRREFGRELPLATLFRQPTVEQLAAGLDAGAEPSPSSTLVCVRAAGSRPPFFCVHPASGNVLRVAALAGHMGPEQPFYAFQSRGLDNGAAPQATVEEMAATYLAELRAVQPAGPYYIGGYSMGGAVAFEMARRLEGEGQEVALLALFDSAAPRGAGPAPADEGDEADWLSEFAHDLGVSL
jgi:amino acid adenylation domain-containing protein